MSATLVAACLTAAGILAADPPGAQAEPGEDAGRPEPVEPADAEPSLLERVPMPTMGGKQFWAD